MEYSDTELAWAAGFFDGEGCTYLSSKTAKNKYTHISISQTEKGLECLYRFQKALGGVGYFHERKINNPNWSRSFFLYIQKQSEVEKVLKLLWPWLSEMKKSQAQKALSQATYIGTRTHCPKGHEYSQDNTRINSKNRRSCIICEKERGVNRRKYKDKSASISEYIKQNKTCKISGCNKKCHAKNFCNTHYQQFKRGKLEWVT
jgi:hypothetical protein